MKPTKIEDLRLDDYVYCSNIQISTLFGGKQFYGPVIGKVSRVHDWPTQGPAFIIIEVVTCLNDQYLPPLVTRYTALEGNVTYLGDNELQMMAMSALT